MKFRTLLLASAAVLVAAPAFAGEDITAAFYTPAQGKFLSSTSLKTSRKKIETGFDFNRLGGSRKTKGWVAGEELTYGVTDNLAVFGAITNTFKQEWKQKNPRRTEKGRIYNNDHNFAYDLGVKYNHNWGKVLGQFVLGYHTWDPSSWYGQVYSEEVNDRWAKAVNGTIKLGYALDCGLTPYTTFTVDGDVDQANRELRYTWFVGAHKMLDKVSLDAGVRYEFGKYDIVGRDSRYGYDVNYEKWYLQAEANYFVKENVTVGVFGDYYLGGRDENNMLGLTRKDVSYDYTIGLNAKVAF